MKVKSANYSNTVSEQDYNFNVVISCPITNLQIKTPINDTNYIINSGPINTSPFTIIQTPACNIVYIFTQTYFSQSTTISQPNWLSFIESLQLYTFNDNLPFDIGVYTIKTTATIS